MTQRKTTSTSTNVQKNKNKNVNKNKTQKEDPFAGVTHSKNVLLRFFCIKKNKSKEWTKEDITLALFWTRAMIALILGPIAGLIPIQGVLGFIIFAIGGIWTTDLWCRKAHNLDPNDFDSPFAFISPGFFPSITLFTFFWISFYSNFALDKVQN
ncbi:rab5-interacting factor [Anaeramoeba flamelloides]|uniref:Rab5-interacting factor n=1 Tax=Anaeramoeba flamelloides TaxID=1746091 RepID=A0ABQ8Z233_9EUKA|nr:rab5-interacting factor [Anaeramoeba flamelloides]